MSALGPLRKLLLALALLVLSTGVWLFSNWWQWHQAERSFADHNVCFITQDSGDRSASVTPVTCDSKRPLAQTFSYSNGRLRLEVVHGRPVAVFESDARTCRISAPVCSFAGRVTFEPCDHCENGVKVTSQELPELNFASG